MKIVPESHVDHALTPAHIRFLMKKFGSRKAFFIKTVRLPRDLAPLPCDLHGPLVGEPAVAESEATYVRRGNRAGESRMCHRPTILVRQMTVIGGLFNGQMALFTAYGGPAAPREPWDPSLKSAAERRESETFWKRHALGAGT